jgi:hypothetical protein
MPFGSEGTLMSQYPSCLSPNRPQERGRRSYHLSSDWHIFEGMNQIANIADAW